MELRQNSNSKRCTCVCCKRELPLEAFYVKRDTGEPSKYCRECQQKASRKYRRKRLVDTDKCWDGRRLIVLTDDPAERMALILEAIRAVRASVERKRRRDLEDDERNFE